MIYVVFLEIVAIKGVQESKRPLKFTWHCRQIYYDSLLIINSHLLNKIENFYYLAVFMLSLRMVTLEFCQYLVRNLKWLEYQMLKNWLYVLRRLRVWLMACHTSYRAVNNVQEFLLKAKDYCTVTDLILKWIMQLDTRIKLYYRYKKSITIN